MAIPISIPSLPLMAAVSLLTIHAGAVALTHHSVVDDYDEGALADRDANDDSNTDPYGDRDSNAVADGGVLDLNGDVFECW